jgi:hypothetical protein
MLSYQGTILEKIIIHFAGNPSNEEPLQLAAAVTEVSEEHQELFVRYLMHSFRSEGFYKFNPSANPVYNACKAIFEETMPFEEASAEIAKHLYEVSTHPKILPGDLFVARLSQVNLNNDLHDVIVLLKAEHEDNFMQVEWQGATSDAILSQGYRLDRVDKACLIFSANPLDGYQVLVVDKTNGNAAEAQYWTDAFLDLETMEDSYHFTQQYMNLTRQFVEEQFPEDFQVNPADQIAMLNRSSKFFKEKDRFELDQFANEVIQAPEVIDSFKRFTADSNAENEDEHSITEAFDINQQAVKKHSGMFKSVLKLDKNFHIYIHGNRNMIERGYDEEKSLNYYKVFFSNEATS